MGLVSKPTSDQLMIGDFIREKKKLLRYKAHYKNRNMVALRSNPSEGEVRHPSSTLEDNYQIQNLHRRHTSKFWEDDSESPFMTQIQGKF